ncbi:MAG TPA: bifunctional UDP-N-acetylglucosamine diphosphorylase/glucosamine-1-phosphate N-acetyltransferase GlmU [Gammaproteobacteria bacterium]|nr:bifunctional UDP-N-acetylglucosamine diphosphorylase/glucosamine-1-phosphate N-acetyltransferase GlmU [Gammaproteobacteria bacterium]
MSTRIIILAAGQGKRMFSDVPKVLHPLAGKPLLEHVIETAFNISSSAPIVVFGHEGDRVREALAHLNVTWVKQEEQLGTGHAVLQAMPHLQDDERVLILYGDVPLISVETLKRFEKEVPVEALGLMTVNLANPTGYGRIVRDDHHQVLQIIEEKDADERIRQITEVNTGIYCVKAGYLKKWLPQLSKHNAQGEYYLTDIVSMALDEEVAIYTVQPEMVEEILGINDRLQLNRLERFYQFQYAQKLMRQGVTLYDPHRLDVRGELVVGRDVVIDVGVIVEGQVTIGNGCVIGPHVCLRNTDVGNRVTIKANSVLDSAVVGDEAIVGPFARIRPGTVLGNQAHVGNFVEIKNSTIGENSKVNHLSYVGDAEVGKQVNVGAGTITCNYDGVNKHKTVIEEGAFIGSGTELIAPITIGRGATIGAGSTLTKDAPADQLTLSRAKQQSIEGWQRPKKETITE